MNFDLSGIQKAAEAFFADQNNDTLTALIKAVFAVLFDFVKGEI